MLTNYNQTKTNATTPILAFRKLPSGDFLVWKISAKKNGGERTVVDKPYRWKNRQEKELAWKRLARKRPNEKNRRGKDQWGKIWRGKGQVTTSTAWSSQASSYRAWIVWIRKRTFHSPHLTKILPNRCYPLQAKYWTSFNSGVKIRL